MKNGSKNDDIFMKPKYECKMSGKIENLEMFFIKCGIMRFKLIFSRSTQCVYNI